MSMKEATKKLAGSIFTIKSVRLQTEYMSARKTKVMLGVHININKDHLGAFFSQFGLVRDVALVISKVGIDTDIELQVTVIHKSFLDISDTLICHRKNIYVIVKAKRPHCWT